MCATYCTLSIKEDEFKKWRYKAIRLRDEWEAGKLTAEEYQQWMEDYFLSEPQKEQYRKINDRRRGNPLLAVIYICCNIKF